MLKAIRIQVNGKYVDVPDGTTVAAAIFRSGETAFRKSVSGEPRAAVCGMGICFECRVTIDDHPNCRSCLITAHDGMVIRTS